MILGIANDMQRSQMMLGLGLIDIGARLDQQLDHIGIALEARDQQRRGLRYRLSRDVVQDVAQHTRIVFVEQNAQLFQLLVHFRIEPVDVPNATNQRMVLVLEWPLDHEVASRRAAIAATSTRSTGGDSVVGIRAAVAAAVRSAAATHRGRILRMQTDRLVQSDLFALSIRLFASIH